MAAEVSSGTSGAILVVDDEPEVRKMVNGVLTAAKYSVFLAESGEQAIRIFQKHGNEITLLLADVVAPGMSGPVLGDRLLEMQPYVKIVFMSGYNASPVVKRFVVERGFQFISKPFSPDQLLTAVKSAIGPAVRAASGP